MAEKKLYTDEELIQMVLDNNLLSSKAPILTPGESAGTFTQSVRMKVFVVDPKKMDVSTDKDKGVKTYRMSLANLGISFEIFGSKES